MEPEEMEGLEQPLADEMPMKVSPPRKGQLAVVEAEVLK